VRPMSELSETIAREQIRLAVLAVPAGAAQKVADAVCRAGIKGILNFAPARLHVPEGVTVRPVDMAGKLQELNYFINANADDSKKD
ncbi:hypothetical protein LCGC14_2692940, partial [marine sediment metagenome]